MPRITVPFALVLFIAFGADAIAETDSTDPNACKKLWSEIGLPAPNPGDHRTTRICHRGYIAGHNDNNKTPDWVIERLTPAVVSGHPRGSGFQGGPGHQAAGKGSAAERL
jgi:hypothetical protein